VDAAEDGAAIAAFLKQPPGVAWILAPRKPERFDAAARQLDEAGIPYARRSRLHSDNSERVLLLDSIGELGGLFAFADAVFMGGTLADRGGHNILEPAMFGKPVIVGPHMENFQAIADQFRAARALVEIPDAAALPDALANLLRSAGETGARAQACAEAARGATDRVVKEARNLYALASYLPAQPWYAIRWALAQVWQWGAARRANIEPRRLRLPVISVGNVNMGGTGKTPVVLLLAEKLTDRGYHPGILTRGYGRESMEDCLTIAPRAEVRTEYTGDEAQIFIRRGIAPVGIGTDRCLIGERLLDSFPVDILLLDDGFQHRKLARDVDLVLIDALDPFASGVFPLGRLREPLNGLARAHILLITRSDASDATPAIERDLRRWNQQAPIFRSSVSPKAWVSHATGERHPLDRPPFSGAGYFCGLGNPASFRHTLQTVGLDVIDCVEFADHHHYRPNELRRLSYQMRSKGADAMVTTEKDAVNLGDPVEDLLPIYWLEIGVDIEREEELLEELRRGLKAGE
jgi:tetraacyldisaccharide 4'-kinase